MKTFLAGCLLGGFFHVVFMYMIADASYMSLLEVYFSSPGPIIGTFINALEMGFAFYGCKAAFRNWKLSRKLRRIHEVAVY